MFTRLASVKIPLLFLLSLLKYFLFFGNIKFPAIDLKIMGKNEIDIYCYLIADILTNVFQKGLLSGPLPNIYYLSKPLNMIGCHGNQKLKFAKHIKQTISS